MSDNSYSLVRLLAALGTIIFLVLMTPIMDLLEIFIVVCLIPMMFLVACGILSEETYNRLRGHLPSPKRMFEDWKAEPAKATKPPPPPKS